MVAFVRKLTILTLFATLISCGGEFETDPQDNLAPVAEFEYRIEDNTLFLDGSSSYDPDGDNLSFSWEFGDGERHEGRSLSVQFPSAGEYHVVLYVDDGRRETSQSRSFSVNDAGVPEIMSAATPTPVVVPTTPLPTVIPQPTPSSSQNPSPSPSPSPTPMVSVTPMPTVIVPPEPTVTPAPTGAPTGTMTPSPTATPVSTPEPTSVPPQPTEEPTPTSTPTQTPYPSVASGKVLYESSDLACAICHGADGQADIFKPIDSQRVGYTHSSTGSTFYTLEEYIVQWMPVNGEAKCVGECATNIAAYIRSWNAVETPTPAVTPTATPSITPTATPAITPTPTPVGSTPYHGTPFVIPGEVEAEDYDIGGFSDSDEINNGGDYRNDAVDIQASTPDGFNVGWTAPGEWLEYTLRIQQTGLYKLDALVASNTNAGAISLNLDGGLLMSERTLPVTGDWQAWQWFTLGDVNLPSGDHILRINIIANGFNLNTLRFTSVAVPTGTPTPTPQPTSTPIPDPLSLEEGYQLYQSKGCVLCHGDIAESSKRGALPVSIEYALANEVEMSTLQLNAREIDAISRALADDEGICRDVDDPGPVVIRRLSNDEYIRTLRDLLGVDISRTQLPADSRAGNFTNVGSSNVNSEHALAYAEIVPNASAAINDSNNSVAQNYVTCDVSVGGQNCAQQIIGNFLPNAFRRSVSGQEVSEYLAHYDFALSEGASAQTALALAIEAVLLSPSFNFIVEIDPLPDLATPRSLSHYEIASRLSYFIWGSMPDETLLTLAAQSQLQDPVVLQEQVDRMLDDEKSQALVDVFFGQWMGINGFDDASNDEFNFVSTELREALVQETKLFFQNLFLRDARDMRDMLSEDRGYVNELLASHYGIAGVTGDEHQLATLPGDRVGLLTQGSFLISTSQESESKPVLRGKWVLDQLLCEAPRNPPPNVGDLPPEGEGDLTLKERLSIHRQDPACAACHSSMDPIGFGLENFNQFGQFRTHYTNGDIVDSSSALADGEEFSGAHELSFILQSDPRYTQCVTEKFLSYARGALVGPRDSCKVNAIASSVDQGTFSVREVIKQIVIDPVFLTRRSADQE